MSRRHGLQLMEVIDDTGCMFNVPQRFMVGGLFGWREEEGWRNGFRDYPHFGDL